MTNKNDSLRVIDQQQNLSASPVAVQPTRFNPYTGGTVTGVENTGASLSIFNDSNLEKISHIEFSISPQNPTRVTVPFKLSGMGIKIKSTNLALSTLRLFFALEESMFKVNHDRIVLGNVNPWQLYRMTSILITPAEFTAFSSGGYTQGVISVDEAVHNLFLSYTLSELYQALTGLSLPTENPAELISLFLSDALTFKVYCQIAFEEINPFGTRIYTKFLYNLPVQSSYTISPPSLWSLGLQQLGMMLGFNPLNKLNILFSFVHRNINTVDIQISNEKEVLKTVQLKNTNGNYSQWAGLSYFLDFTNEGPIFKPSKHFNSLTYELTNKKQELFDKTRKIIVKITRINTLTGLDIPIVSAASATFNNVFTYWSSNIAMSKDVIIDLIKNRWVFKLTFTGSYDIYGVFLVYTVNIGGVTKYVHRFKALYKLRVEPGSAVGADGTVYYLEEPFLDFQGMTEGSLNSYMNASTLTASKVEIYPVRYTMDEPSKGTSLALPTVSLQDYFKTIVTFTTATKVLNFLPTKLPANLPKVYMKFTVQVQKKLLATSTTYDTLAGGTFNLVLQYNGPYTVVTVTQNGVAITSLNLKTLMASKGLYRILVTPTLTADVAPVFPAGTGLVNILYTYA